MSLQVPGSGVQSPRLDPEVCIREAIRKYYVFIHKVDNLREDIGRLGNIDEQTRMMVLDQLDDIESESQREGRLVWEVGGMHCTCVCSGFGDLVY